MPGSQSRTVVLIYHAIGDETPAVPMHQFEKQIRWLAGNATLVTPEKLFDGEIGHGLRVCMTFDDGYLSVVEKAFPILDENQIPATVYINPGLVDANLRADSDPKLGHYPNEKFMNWEDIQRLSTAGWTIGSHGVEHLDLTTLNESDVTYQLSESRKQITERLGQPCEHFAYTWGRRTPGICRLAESVGYKTAAAGRHGPVLPTSDLFAFPRIDIRSDYEINDFANVVSGHWDFVKYIQALREHNDASYSGERNFD